MTDGEPVCWYAGFSVDRGFLSTGRENKSPKIRLKTTVKSKKKKAFHTPLSLLTLRFAWSHVQPPSTSAAARVSTRLQEVRQPSYQAGTGINHITSPRVAWLPIPHPSQTSKAIPNQHSVHHSCSPPVARGVCGE